MFKSTWPFCIYHSYMFKFGPRGFQRWFYIHCSSNQKKAPSAQTFSQPNRSKLGKLTMRNQCDMRMQQLIKLSCTLKYFLISELLSTFKSGGSFLDAYFVSSGKKRNKTDAANLLTTFCF